MKKIFSFLITISLLLPSISFAQIDTSFDPNKLIDDRVFSDTQTFGGADGIQKFLESKNSILANTSPEFVEKLKEPSITLLKQTLEDPRPNLPRNRTAAELIWDAGQQSGLNPQVILVTLQKEQGLITNHQNDSPEKLQRALDFAMGFDCPDSSGCSQSFFPGFYFQLFGNVDSGGNRYLGATKSLMKSFNSPSGRGPVVNGVPAKVGDSITLNNTLGGYDNVPAQSVVTLFNKATTALYRYTPHVFNGNYNFVKYFNDWFRYPNGTIVKISNDINTYIIQNGTRQLLPAFVAQVRNLNTGNAVTLSPNEVQNYPQDKVYGPADNTIVKVAGQTGTYVFMNNIRRPVSSFVLTQRGLNPDQSLSITAEEANMFTQGPVLLPKDGTVIKSSTTNTYYLVDQDNLKLFSDFTLKQRKADKLAVTVTDDELTSYPKQGYVAPLDGSIVRGQTDKTVYLIQKGLKRPITAAVFKNLKLAAKQVATISDTEMSGITIGAYAEPKDKTFYKIAETGDLFYFKDGAAHSISKYVAKQQGIGADYTFSLAEHQEWQVGIAVPPRDGTLVKGSDSGTVFLVDKKQLKPLTAAAFKKRKYKTSKIVTLPQSEVDGYAQGDTITK
jgi:hypothetical protein